MRCHGKPTLRIDQHPRVEHTSRVELAFRRAQRVGEEVWALLVVARAVHGTDGVVLLDPSLERTMTLDELHADSDYSIWEGFACRGYPVITVQRGKVVVEHGKLTGSTSDGEWLPRQLSDAVRAGPAV